MVAQLEAEERVLTQEPMPLNAISEGCPRAVGPLAMVTGPLTPCKL